MVLSDAQLDVLIDTVEERLSRMLVSGCEDREELAMLKRCRLELRVARAAHPRGTAGKPRFHPLRRRDESAPLGSDPLPAREGDGPGLSSPGEDRGPVSRRNESIPALVRPSKGHSESLIRTRGLTVNINTRTVEVDDQALHLTGKEYGILVLLSLNKGSIVTKEMFLNHLYGGLDEPDPKIIDVFICKLRKKLKAATGSNDYIETLGGRGYMLRDPVLGPPPENVVRLKSGPVRGEGAEVVQIKERN